MRKRRLSLLVAAAVVVPLVGVASAGAALAPWSLCRDLIHEWDRGDARTECTKVTVPLDYARPEGRQIDLMVSRIKATAPEKRQGVVLINPGGPGNPGLYMPVTLSESTVGGIGADHDLIGFDPRGAGFSGGKECDRVPEDGPDPDPRTSRREQYRRGYEQTARQNIRCAGYDPEFIAGMSTNVVAQDLDRIRIALGEKKISYYGISWGTALGAVYRSRYDNNVDRMLLDSVMPPDFSMREMNNGQVAATQANFERFAGWVAAKDHQYHLGRNPYVVQRNVTMLARQLDEHPRVITPPGGQPVLFNGAQVQTIMTYQQAHWPEMAASLIALRDGGIPPLQGDEDTYDSFGLRDSNFAGILMQVSVLCNDQGADPDAETLWREGLRRRASYPLFSWRASYRHWCAGWPLPAQPWNLHRGASALQLVGHRTETVTPYAWAHDMRRRIGGALLTVENGAHGSLSLIPCGSKAVEFFSTGHTDNGTCTGRPARSQPLGE